MRFVVPSFRKNAHLWLFFGVAALACGGTVAPGTSSGTTSSTSGSSGSSGSSGTSTSSGGSTSSTTSSSTSSSSGGPKVPTKHRATSQACPVDRASPPVTDPPKASTCVSHADCTAGSNGRCLAQARTGIYGCSYDTCATDADCTVNGNEKRACECREANTAGTNHCKQGTCATDADCPGGNYCSPSQGSCGQFGGTIGYFCHAPADECVNDSDCPGANTEGHCRFVPTVGHFKCEDSQCAG